MNIQEQLKNYVSLIHAMYQGRYVTTIDNVGNPKVEGMIQGRKGLYMYELVATFRGIDFYLYNDQNKTNLLNKRLIKDTVTEQRFLRYIKNV